MTRRILITGSCGLVGRAMTRALTTAGYRVRGFDPAADYLQLSRDQFGRRSDKHDPMASLFLLKGLGRTVELVRLPHALADVARLPVREVVSALHFKADLTLGLGKVAFDYLAK